MAATDLRAACGGGAAAAEATNSGAAAAAAAARMRCSWSCCSTMSNGVRSATLAATSAGPATTVRYWKLDACVSEPSPPDESTTDLAEL